MANLNYLPAEGAPGWRKNRALTAFYVEILNFKSLSAGATVRLYVAKVRQPKSQTESGKRISYEVGVLILDINDSRVNSSEEEEGFVPTHYERHTVLLAANLTAPQTLADMPCSI